MDTLSITIREVQIPSGDVKLDGDLTIPPGAKGIIVFVHGSGSSRNSVRNRYVAEVIQQSGIATLLFDPLMPDEESVDMYTRHLRFDIGLLADRLLDTIEWLARMPETEDLKVGLFGTSTGGAAALVAAARSPEAISAVVSRGGRPDLAGEHLPRVYAPVLLIVGGDDDVVIPAIVVKRQSSDVVTGSDREIETIIKMLNANSRRLSSSNICGRHRLSFLRS